MTIELALISAVGIAVIMLMIWLDSFLPNGGRGTPEEEQDWYW